MGCIFCRCCCCKPKPIIKSESKEALTTTKTKSVLDVVRSSSAETLNDNPSIAHLWKQSLKEAEKKAEDHSKHHMRIISTETIHHVTTSSVTILPISSPPSVMPSRAVSPDLPEEQIQEPIKQQQEPTQEEPTVL